MSIAMGALGWPPPVFWSATPHEFWAAYDGWKRVNCVEPTKPGPLTPDELDALEEMKRRFPDGN